MIAIAKSLKLIKEFRVMRSFRNSGRSDPERSNELVMGISIHTCVPGQRARKLNLSR